MYQYIMKDKGSTEITQQINQKYDALFAILSKEKKSDDQSYTHEENERFKAVLNEILGFNMTVEIMGGWIWCFDCYPFKNQLKALGFTWCSKKEHGYGTMNHFTDTTMRRCN